ncbi:sugar phosphate permease [Propionibacteriaceae bacterium ES.041]|uniref:MFS transporter n=1 Tax=Enemella evansiae TaxID=2016499 RepID=A0A255GPR0_9ACTN|nr:MFS transporter [Enemella evansiae]PFG69282.1 sugar phosphate permease [Propionibacteriaceae bacterium ES.041]OYO02971.1 MFS transporter [Enemella evansiae]OYO14178.1 MFS transporter [Enemella evansiae]OYO17382.1 MFS transporter [Enemella evansiae]TDO91929.1 sugar phosphate permease [Enemella evansiae]
MSTSDTTGDRSEERAVLRRIDARLLPFLLLCYTFAYLDRVNIGFAKLHMQADIPAITEAAFGLGAGLFFIAYACFEIPSNLLMHRIGARRTITRIMVLWGLTSAAMMFVNNLTTFYVLRILLGIFEAGFAPGIILYLTYWYPVRRMARAMGIYMLAGPIGSIIGSSGSALIIRTFDGVWGLAGWQWMFLIEGLPCVVMGIIFWKVMSDRPEQADWLSDREKQVVRRAVGEGKDEATHSFATALKQPQVHIMAAAYFGIMCGIYAATFWLPTILKENGVSDNFTVGLLSAVPYVFTIVVMIWLSRRSDAHAERRWHAIVPTVVAAVALLVAAFSAKNFAVSFPALCVAICAVWGAYTVFWAMPGEHFGGTAAAGGIAFINTIGILGGFVAPYLIGLVKQATGSTQGGLIAMVVLLVVSIIALLLIRPSTVLQRERVST